MLYLAYKFLLMTLLFVRLDAQNPPDTDCPTTSQELNTRHDLQSKASFTSASCTSIKPTCCARLNMGSNRLSVTIGCEKHCKSKSSDLATPCKTVFCQTTDKTVQHFRNTSKFATCPDNNAATVENRPEILCAKFDSGSACAMAQYIDYSATKVFIGCKMDCKNLRSSNPSVPVMCRDCDTMENCWKLVGVPIPPTTASSTTASSTTASSTTASSTTASPDKNVVVNETGLREVAYDILRQLQTSSVSFLQRPDTIVLVGLAIAITWNICIQQAI